MQQVEKHIISKGHESYEEIDHIAFLSKNLYNRANYIIRQEFIKTSKECEEGKLPHAKWIRYNELQKMMQVNKEPDYTALPAKVSQHVLKTLDKNWKSFFVSIKDWKRHPAKYTGRPKLPRYKHKTEGRNILIYTVQAIGKIALKQYILNLSGTKINLRILHNKINQARIVPMSNDRYKIEVVYDKEIKDEKLNEKNISGTDIGVNNLAAVTSNLRVVPILINGRPLKSINQYFNKRKAELVSDLMKLNPDRRTTKKIDNLTHKRNCKIEDYMHKASRFEIDYLKSIGAGTLVIGKNPFWKQDVNIGSKNNQNFVSIPHARYIEMLKYKAELIGMRVIVREEAHTSKCSFLDEEKVGHHEKYAGRRVKRGLFKSANGTKINADCNGSGNIVRKEVPNAFENGIEGVVVRPVTVTIPFSGKPDLGIITKANRKKFL